MERKIMQNWERSEFDEQWKDAFAGAEMTPSASVWANVDRDLTLADNNKGKRRIIFYQRLAAACVLFALTAGGFGVYYWNQNELQVAHLNSGKNGNVKSQGQTRERNISSKSQSTGVVADSSGENETKMNSKKKTELDNPSTNKNISSVKNSPVESKAGQLNSPEKTEVSTHSKSSASEKNVSPPSRQVAENNAAPENRRSNRTKAGLNPGDQKSFTNPTAAISITQEKLAHDNRPLSSGMESEPKQSKRWLAASLELPSPELLATAKVQGEPRFAEIYRTLPYISGAFMSESKNHKFEHEKLWASVTAGSGTYSESSGSSYNSYAAAKVYNVAALQSSVPGSSLFSLGNNSSSTGAVPTVGKSYSYGLIGGVKLTERWVLQTGVQYMNQSIGNSSPYSNYGGGSLTSTNEFVSVPVQAGYLLVNRKVGWQLNPGVSTDFFIQNTTGNQQASVTQGAGADSPYRSVNFAGLMSSEFSYRLGKNYRFSLVPGMRYAFNPVLKSMTTGNAMTWDLGFRFRYIFK